MFARYILVTTFALVFAVTSAAAQTAPRLFMAGDSTMADKPLDSPERGWGMVLPHYLEDGSLVHNHAVNGRSTKSFIDEGRWQAIVDQLRAGDSVIIQFGHNDEKLEDPKRYTDPRTSFRDNLRRFVRDVRAKKAAPMLATPIARRKFDAAGRLAATHGAYPDAVRAVARELRVPLLDLEYDTSVWLQAEGDARSKRFFMWIAPGQYPTLPEGRQDDTHLVDAGARRVAELAIARMRVQKLPIAGQIVRLDVAVEALSAPDPLVREKAAKTIGRLGSLAAPAIDTIVLRLADEDHHVRGAAAAALGQIGAPAVPALIRAIADPQAVVRRSAGIALGRMGRDAEPAVSALVAAAADPDDHVRHVAIVALGEIGDSTASVVAALTTALHDRAEAVRAAARGVLQRAAPGVVTGPADTAAITATIDRLTPALMAELHVPGVTVALVHDGQVAWSGVYGVADVKSGTPVTRDTAFEAASMSKPVFALLAMQAVDQQRFDLDRPLAAYAEEDVVPASPERRRITARMVLTHTSGLPNWRPGGDETNGPLPLLFTPGLRYTYSGEGFGVLQRAVEHLTGQSLETLAHTRLFAPLGLQHTSFSWTPTIGETLAAGHRDDGSWLAMSRYVHPHAAYTLYTTAEDYARILIDVMKAWKTGAGLVSQSAIRQMFEHHVTLDDADAVERPGNTGSERVFRGLGWQINSSPNGDIVQHSGSNGTGFRSFSQFNPTRGTAIVILTNGTRGNELWTRLVAAVGDY